MRNSTNFSGVAAVRPHPDMELITALWHSAFKGQEDDPPTFLASVQQAEMPDSRRWRMMSWRHPRDDG